MIFITSIFNKRIKKAVLPFIYGNTLPEANAPATLTHPRRLLAKKTCNLIAITALLASLFFLACPVQAQTFKSVPLDCGGWFSGFAQADNGRLYGYGDVFGAWRSDNGGTNWSYLNWGIPGGEVYGTGMAVQKDNADVVYYATSTSLWKSTNGGTSWTALLTDIGIDANNSAPRFRGSSPILIRSNNPNEIWFAGPRIGLTGWLWKSSDGGTTWAKAGGTTFNTIQAQTLHNVTTYANQIWVGTTNGLYVSTNGGTSFSRIGTSNRLADVGMISRFTSGAFAGVGLVVRSNNGGGGVSRITATDYNNVATYTITDAATSGLYFGYPTGLQIFSDGSSSAWNTSADRHGFSPAGDGGQTFTLRATTLNTSMVPVWSTTGEMTASNHPDYGSDQVIEAVGNPNKWMITGGKAPMYSLDKGLSWQYFPNGSGLAGVKTYLAGVSRYDVNRIYIPASDIGSAIVTDGGTSGQATLSTRKSYIDQLHGSFRILEGPNTQNLVLAGVHQGNNANLILKSANGGSTWSELNLSSSGLPTCNEGITKSVMSITDANDFMVVLGEDGSTGQRVYRTTNGGTTFSGVTGLPNNSPTGFRYGPQSCFIERDATLANVRYFVARGQDLYKSTNSGANWSAITHPFGIGVWVWCLATDPIRSNNLWAAGDYAGVKVSRDGGLTWTPTAQNFNARYVSSCDGKVAIFGYKDSDAQPQLYYSSDDGATFTALTSPTNAFHFVQGITVDRNGKVWVSWNSCTVVTPNISAPDTQAPTAPTSLSSSNITTTEFTLSWTAATDNVGVTGYDIYRGTTLIGSTTTATTFNVTGLTANTTYSMTVKAKDGAGNISAASTALNVTTSALDIIAPSVPSALSASSITLSGFTLNWTASSDNVAVTGYEIFRNGVSIGTSSTTSFNVTGLSSNTTYAMTVRAYDAVNNYSAQSSPALNVTTSAGTSTGTGYYWRNMTSATSNSTRTAAPGINDNNLSTDVVVPDNANANQWQGAGMTWATAKANITKVEYFNGTQINNGLDNGCFTAGIQLQYSTNGTAWTNASGWSISPVYPYDWTASDQVYTFTGPALPSCKGVRVVGQVYTNNISWAIKIKEIRVFNSSNVLQRTANNTQVIGNSNSEVTVYPNPVTNGRFYISLSGATLNNKMTIFLTDITGKKVLENKFISNGVNQRIDVNKLTTGVYIMNLVNEKSTLVKKIIIGN